MMLPASILANSADIFHSLTFQKKNNNNNNNECYLARVISSA